VVCARGFATFVAHPERHLTEDLAGWMRAAVDEGAQLQATAAALAEGPASETLCALASAGLVHVLASDAHSSHGGRRLELSPAVARLERHGLSPGRVRWIAEHAPAAVLAGEAVTSPTDAEA
jgi:tyrosine-protein phosphatase YwqE